MLAGAEPVVEIGDHCAAPFACDFVGPCPAKYPKDRNAPFPCFRTAAARSDLRRASCPARSRAAALPDATCLKVHDATIAEARSTILTARTSVWTTRIGVASAEAFAALPFYGAVIAYDARFERGVGAMLAAALPRLRSASDLPVSRIGNLFAVGYTQGY